MIPPFSTAIAKPFKLKASRGKSTSGSESTVVPVQEDTGRIFLWRVMGSLCLLWLFSQERSVFAWPPSSASCAEAVATVFVAVLLVAPSLVPSAQWLRRTVAGGASLLIVATFAAIALASGESNSFLSLALSLVSSNLLPMLAVVALGFTTPSLLLPAKQAIPSAAPLRWHKRSLKFRLLSSRLGVPLSSRLLYGLDLLTAVVGLLALSYVSPQSAGGLASRVILAAVVVSVAGLAAYAAGYRGNLILESPYRGIEFSIPEQFVRGVLASVLFGCLGIQLLAAFHSPAPVTWLVLLLVLWVTARIVMPLLRTGIMGREDEAGSRKHRERACLCIGAIPVLSGLLWLQGAAAVNALYAPLLLLLALAALGIAAFTPDSVEQEPLDTAGVSAWVGIKVRLDGNPQALAVDGVLPRLSLRGAKVFAFLIRQVRLFQQVSHRLDQVLVLGMSAARSGLRRAEASRLPAVAANILLVFAICWLALKDWLTSDAQVYPFAASLVVTLAVGGAAVAARFVRRKELWRDVILSGAAAFCMIALMLPAMGQDLHAVMPVMGLLTFALAFPKLLFLARRPEWFPQRTARAISSDEKVAGENEQAAGGDEAAGTKLKPRGTVGDTLRKLLLTRVATGTRTSSADGFSLLLRGAFFGKLRQVLLTPVEVRRRVQAPAFRKQPVPASSRPPVSAVFIIRQVLRLFEPLSHWVQDFLHKEVTIRQSLGEPKTSRASLSGVVVSLLYGVAALLGATTLLLAPSETPFGWLPSLLVTAGTAALMIFSARSLLAVARILPLAVWGLCGFLYAYPALTQLNASSPNIQGMLIGTGLSDSFLWNTPAFITNQGWLTWALTGFILLWALDKNAQFLSNQVLSNQVPSGLYSKNLALNAELQPSQNGSASRHSEKQPSGPRQLKATQLKATLSVEAAELSGSFSALELSVGATAALTGLLFGDLLCPVALAFCAASLVIAARMPCPQAAANKAEKPVCASWVRPAGRLRFAWVSIILVATAIGFGSLCAAVWSLPGLGGISTTFLPLMSIPKVMRDTVPSDLPAAASWQDGFCLLRCGFGSQVSVPPSMSATVAIRMTGADQSASPLRVAAAALLAPAFGRWLPAARLEELYLNDRNYGLPLSVQGRPGATNLGTAAQYYFHAEPQALTQAQIHFLLGEQPPSGEPLFHFTPASLMPTFTELNAPQLHLEVFVPPVRNFSYAHHDGSVNNQGILVSSAITGDGIRSFVRESGQMHALIGLGGDRGSDCAVKINDAGQAAGWCTAKDGTDHAALWEASGQVRDLGTLPGFANSHARSINSQGEVVGYAFNDTAGAPLENASHAFLWENGQMHDLGVPPRCTGSRAYAINDAGQIAGWVMVKGGGTHAAVWENNRFCDLGAFPGGQVSVANAINNAGQVVGSAQHKDGHVSAFLWQNGILHDLGMLNGDIYSSARDINNLGQVVGMSRPDLRLNLPGGRAFVWDGIHGLRDLSTLLDIAAPLRSGFSRNCQPLSINDRDQVLGFQFVGTRRTFLMTPASLDKRGIAAQLGAGRVYRLLCVNSGKAVGVRGASRSDQAAIVQWQPNGSQDQEWMAAPQAGGFWEFVNRNSGKCLEAVGPASLLGGAIRQVAPNSNRFQQWQLQPLVDGSFKLVNHGTGLLMDVEDVSTQDGARLHQWKDLDGSNQHWLFQIVR